MTDRFFTGEWVVNSGKERRRMERAEVRSGGGADREACRRRALRRTPQGFERQQKSKEILPSDSPQVPPSRIPDKRAAGPYLNNVFRKLCLDFSLSGLGLLVCDYRMKLDAFWLKLLSCVNENVHDRIVFCKVKDSLTCKSILHGSGAFGL